VLVVIFGGYLTKNNKTSDD